jgi:flagellar biosynthesis protein FlhA
MAPFLRYADYLVAVFAVVVIGILIFPLPEAALDLLLVVNITMALTILLVTVYTTEPLQFSAFPTLLLLVTLFRLALNVSATRLILLHGNAGSVIRAFGDFVVGGNYVVGVVVFLILVVIQFVVITNGAGRVAEVGARFTLDAMPGKQMAIDADLNAGIIDEQEARRRRKQVAQEADFYGAMDGSSKFVRGDAIAAIIMIIINVLGGFVVGIFQQGMDLSQALQNFTILTVGEGILTQIPALLISTSAGLMVTKTSSDLHMGAQLTNQLLAYPKALGIAAAILAIISLGPGMPKVPFLMAAAAAGLMSRALAAPPAQTLRKAAAQGATGAAAVTEGGAPASAAPKAPENMMDLLEMDPLETEIGYGLVPLADPKQGGNLLQRITEVRRSLAMELGLVVPPVRVRDNMQLKPNEYTVKLRGVEVARGTAMPGHCLAMDTAGTALPMSGIETQEPAFGLPALWITEAQRTDAELAGYTVVDPMTVVITHLSEEIKRNAPELMGRQETQVLLDHVRQSAPALVAEVVPEVLSVGDVQKVLQNLLRERVPIRDLVSILEALADAGRVSKDSDLLTEYARAGLARTLTQQWRTPNGPLYVITLDPRWEQLLADSVRSTDAGTYAALDPHRAQKLLDAVKDESERMAAQGQTPLLLCASRVRRHVRRLVERSLPHLVILAQNEVASGVAVEAVGRVRFEDEDQAV